MWIIVILIPLVATCFAVSPMHVIGENPTYGPAWATLTSLFVAGGGVGLAFLLGHLFRAKNN